LGTFDKRRGTCLDKEGKKITERAREGEKRKRKTRTAADPITRWTGNEAYTVPGAPEVKKT
jgi:hypothetical protein